MFLSDDEAAVKKVRFWATQARDPAPHYQHSEIGYNYRMSNIVAGIGRGQLVYLNEHIQKKRQIYETYKQAFKDLPVSMNPYSKDSKPNFWLSCMLIDQNCPVTPTQIREALEKENIESRPIWKPMHMQPICRTHPFVSVEGNGRGMSNAYRPGKGIDVGMDLFHRGLCLPSDNKMTAEEQDAVIDIIHRCFM